MIHDEAGRGTSTYDGMSLAWAIAEYLHDDVQSLTLFATHYHELTRLTDLLPGCRNYKAAVEEVGGEIVFLHRIEEGAESSSYGVHVARLAGLPPRGRSRYDRVRLARARPGCRRRGGRPAPAPPPAARRARHSYGRPLPGRRGGGR